MALPAPGCRPAVLAPCLQGPGRAHPLAGSSFAPNFPELLALGSVSDQDEQGPCREADGATGQGDAEQEATASLEVTHRLGGQAHTEAAGVGNGAKGDPEGALEQTPPQQLPRP